MQRLTLEQFHETIVARTGALSHEERDHVARAHAYASTSGNALLVANLIKSARRIDADPMFVN